MLKNGSSIPLPPISVLAIDAVDQLADRLPHCRRYFTLLLAWDAPEMDQPELIALVRPLVERGLAYFSAWGNRCEKVHDAVDQCFDERKPDAGVAEYMLMTTWHSDEPLREAVWSFKTLDIPSESPVFADFDRFAVAIGNPAWAREMEGTLAALEAAKPHEE